MSHVILHKRRDSSVASHPPNPKVLATMMGAGRGWDAARIEWEVSKMARPVNAEAVVNGKVQYTEAMAQEWIKALTSGGLTETEALVLFAKRIQQRNGYPKNVLLDYTELPTHIRGDRYFRNAMVWDETEPNKCRCDRTKAEDIHMTNIRDSRNKEWVKLDVPFIRALEVESSTERRRIIGLKNALRNIPQTFDLRQYPTLEELQTSWPEGLPR